jgi:hypothetical protein
VKCKRFNTKAEVAEWGRSHIEVDIIWQSNPTTLMNMVSTKLCHLCVADCMVIGHNFNHQHRHKKMLNLKNELGQYAPVRQGSYSFHGLSRKGGSDESKEAQKQSW